MPLREGDEDQRGKLTYWLMGLLTMIVFSLVALAWNDNRSVMRENTLAIRAIEHYLREQERAAMRERLTMDRRLQRHEFALERLRAPGFWHPDKDDWPDDG